MSHPFDKPRGGTIVVEREGVRSDEDESRLHRTLISGETDNEMTWAVEYRDFDGGPIVHRSVHIHLKRGIELSLGIGNVGGP